MIYSIFLKFLTVFHGDILVAQAASFFTAGFETSSSTISFGLFELAKEVSVQLSRPINI